MGAYAANCSPGCTNGNKPNKFSLYCHANVSPKWKEWFHTQLWLTWNTPARSGCWRRWTSLSRWTVDTPDIVSCMDAVEVCPIPESLQGLLQKVRNHGQRPIETPVRVTNIKCICAVFKRIRWNNCGQIQLNLLWRVPQRKNTISWAKRRSVKI